MKKKNIAEITHAKVEANPAASFKTVTAGPSQKLTISLFPTDLEAMDQLLEMLRTHCGGHPSRSHALKIGLRIAVETAKAEALKRHTANIKKEDGRNRNR